MKLLLSLVLFLLVNCSIFTQNKDVHIDSIKIFYWPINTLPRGNLTKEDLLSKSEIIKRILIDSININDVNLIKFENTIKAINFSEKYNFGAGYLVCCILEWNNKHNDTICYEKYYKIIHFNEYVIVDTFRIREFIDSLIVNYRK